MTFPKKKKTIATLLKTKFDNNHYEIQNKSTYIKFSATRLFFKSAPNNT